MIETNAGKLDYSASRPQFLPNLQIVRFIAAVLVVIEHLQFKTRDFGFMAHGWLVDFKPVYFPVGVDIFFVVSGFIMFHLSRGHFAESGYWRRFLLRRAIRIVPLYWLFTLLIMLAMAGVAGTMNHTVFDAAHIAASFAFVPWPRFDGHVVPVLSGGWTLNYEMLFYALFAVALRFRRRYGTALVTTAIAGLAASHVLVPAEWWVVSYWTSPIILDFLLGVGLALMYDRGLRLSPAAAVFVLVAGVAWLLVSKHFDAHHHIGRLLSLGLPAALVCAALVLAPVPTRPGVLYRAALAGGDASYALYLSHAFTLSLIASAWHRLGLADPYLFFGLSLVFSIAVAWLIYEQLETRMTARLNRLAGTLAGHPRAPANTRDRGSCVTVVGPAPAPQRDAA